MRLNFKVLSPWRFNIAALLPLLNLFGCGSSSDSQPAPAPPYAEKVSHITLAQDTVVFAVEVASNRFELFSVDPVTGGRQGLTDSFSANSGRLAVAISPDASRVAYRADKDLDGVDELYANTLDGDNEALLVDDLPKDSDFYHWQWLDNQRILFRSDPDLDQVYELQTILADGSALATVSADLTVRCFSSQCWRLSGDGQSITFRVEAINDSSQVSQNLYAVNADGTGLVLLNQVLSEESRIPTWQWTDSNNLIAYISQEDGGSAALYTVTPDGLTRTLISANGLASGVESFQFSPDMTQLAFTEDDIAAANPGLYRVLLDGTERSALLDTFSILNPTLGLWQWSPDSLRVAYRDDERTQGVSELFTVEIDGQWHRKMNPNLLPEGVVEDLWQWSPDGGYLAFFADVDTLTAYDELYISAADGQSVSRVNVDLQAGARLMATDNLWLEDASRVIYQVIDGRERIEAIYSVLPDGTDNQRLSQSLGAEQSLLPIYKVSPSASQLLYRLEDPAESAVALYLTQVDGTPPVGLSTLGEVEAFFWLEDGSRVIYSLTSSNSISQQLYSVLADGSGKVRLY